jgi:hypothetical protein
MTSLPARRCPNCEVRDFALVLGFFAAAFRSLDREPKKRPPHRATRRTQERNIGAKSTR